VKLLAPHLTAGNVGELLTAARHKSKREVEHMVAALRPLPPVPPSIRKLPVKDHRRLVAPDKCRESPRLPMPAERGPELDCVPAAVMPSAVAHATSVKPSAKVTPLAPERYRLQVTISTQTHAKLRRAQDLLRHSIPNGDPAAILDRALTLLVENLEKTRAAATTRPQRVRPTAPRSRHVPATVKRQVWVRDQGQCAFFGANGRCTERGFLELHHVVPFAEGGPTTAENLQLRCRAHNVYEAERVFGPFLLRERVSAYSCARSGPSSPLSPQANLQTSVAIRRAQESVGPAQLAIRRARGHRVEIGSRA
jgi:5-methylcytosine-specific restriction endonuclease McrA